MRNENMVLGNVQGTATALKRCQLSASLSGNISFYADAIELRKLIKNTAMYFNQRFCGGQTKENNLLMASVLRHIFRGIIKDFEGGVN